MNERSMLITRMARRELANLARARRDYAATARELQAAEALLARLDLLIDHKRGLTAAAGSVAALREGRRLNDQLCAEAERNRAKIRDLQRIAQAKAEALAQLDHRLRSYDEAAATARKAEREERDRRAEANAPPRARA